MKRVRARAPLRLGIAGGGTDLSPFCDEHGGCVLNYTIGLYAYGFIQENSDWTVRFTANDIDLVDETTPLPRLPTDSANCLILHRGVYNRIVKDFHRGRPLSVSVSSVVEAPPGSGLGSSSALVVALVKAFAEYLDLPLGDYEIARLAYEIERVDLGLMGGRQDQYASAFGGCNFIEFLPEDRVIVNPLRVHEAHRLELDSSLVICHTGRSRVSANIIDQQTQGIRSGDPASLTAMHQIKSDAVEMKLCLLRGDIGKMAQVMKRSWEAKKQTASQVSTSEIDIIYETALKNGAQAGKISGAGGGGFLMLLTEPESRFRLARALREIEVNAVPFHFVEGGAQSWTLSS
jgi:D-glycero-alpha-D-manno-heptose-7-phosphate kinase